MLRGAPRPALNVLKAGANRRCGDPLRGSVGWAPVCLPPAALQAATPRHDVGLANCWVSTLLRAARLVCAEVPTPFRGGLFTVRQASLRSKRRSVGTFPRSGSRRPKVAVGGGFW